MTAKQRLIQEIEQASEPLIEVVLDFLLRTKAESNPVDSVHPLAKFAGILSDEEAQELQVTIADEFAKINVKSK
jgi:hypothetical protein